MRVSDEISAEHPALAGHFPTQPIAPGALLLRHIEAAILKVRPGATVAGIERAKFIAPAPLGSSFDIEISDRGAEQVTVKVHWGDRPIFSGSFNLEGAAK